mmetsp:Transcript_19134/g.22122  ORF Transcript_19134/g.22122 Transcript_19134/m.22122 type:complete len:142 (+) Transcript_19134:97-522(+)
MSIKSKNIMHVHVHPHAHPYTFNHDNKEDLCLNNSNSVNKHNHNHKLRHLPCFPMLPVPVPTSYLPDVVHVVPRRRRQVNDEVLLPTHHHHQVLNGHAVVGEGPTCACTCTTKRTDHDHVLDEDFECIIRDITIHREKLVN